MTTGNRLQRTLGKLDGLPGPLRRAARNLALRRAVPFTGTAGLDFVALTPERSEIHIANRGKVQNHIGGIHAAAMGLLAETATGMVVGMNVRDDCLPLCKTMKVAFKKRATGALTAQAHLTDAQRQLLASETKGEVIVAVTVTDEAGVQPIECEFVWAWIPKDQKPANGRNPS
jgi:acyl-coenzyme A thioesterase PaaI-like protein